MMFAAFLVQPKLPTRALRPEILHLHRQRRCDSREGVGEGGDQRPVAQIPYDRVSSDKLATEPTLSGYEAMAMLRKGQVRNISGNDIRAQATFIAGLFQVAA
jgi:hypothetical protein